jgi:hypothetical protein
VEFLNDASIGCIQEIYIRFKETKGSETIYHASNKQRRTIAAIPTVER